MSEERDSIAVHNDVDQHDTSSLVSECAATPAAATNSATASDENVTQSAPQDEHASAAVVRWHVAADELNESVDIPQATTPSHAKFTTGSEAAAGEIQMTVILGDDHDAADPEQHEPSTIIHPNDVYTQINASPAAASIVIGSSINRQSQQHLLSPTTSAAAATPASLNWVSDLRADWAGPSEEMEAAAKERKQREEKQRVDAITAASNQLQLSPAVQAIPPLQGDVVWNTSIRKVLVAEHTAYIRASKLAHYRFHRMIRQITSMFLPVTLLAVIIIVYNYVVVQHSANDLLTRSILVYTQSSDDSTGTKFLGSFENSLTVLAAILCITFMFIFFYVVKMKRMLRYFLTGIIMILLLPWIYFALQVIDYYDIDVDYLSFVFISLQYLGVGYLSLIYFAETPTWINRIYLVLLSMSVTWPFMEFPEWTTWMTIVVLTLYDFVAVLAPCGPLKYIMDSEAAKKLSGIQSTPDERLPGMMYIGEYFSLGLGDIIFYGALMGRAANAGILSLVAACLGVLMGLAGTIVWSYFTRANAIPALPLSVFFGLSAYAATTLAIVPMLEQAAQQGWQT